MKKVQLSNFEEGRRGFVLCVWALTEGEFRLFDFPIWKKHGSNSPLLRASLRRSNLSHDGKESNLLHDKLDLSLLHSDVMLSELSIAIFSAHSTWR